MNVFAGLAISSVMPLQSFVEMDVEDKLYQFGALVGPFRMASRVMIFIPFVNKAVVDTIRRVDTSN
jgi:hypothetical protein